MPHSLQATLLRVLETGTFSRVGGETEMPLDIRVLASTNRDAKEAVKAGAFDLLQKPVDPYELEQEIARTLHGGAVRTTP